MPFGECEVRGEFCKSRDFEIGTSDGKPNEKLSIITESFKRKKSLHRNTILLDLIKNYPELGL